MNSFAFIVQPITIQQIKKIWPAIRVFPDFIVKPSLKNIPAFKVSHIKQVRSAQRKEIEGFFVACPLTPRYILEPNQEFVLQKIISTAHFAEKLGVKILGLSRYAAIVTDNGVKLAGNIHIPVTTGSTFTAWSVFEAIYRATKMRQIDLAKSILAVIDADSSIGQLCLNKLCEHIPEVIITGKDKVKLEKIRASMQELYHSSVSIDEDVRHAAKTATVLVNASSAFVATFDIQDLKPGVLACDVSLLRNIASKADSRKDITVIDGDVIKMKYPIELGVDTGLPKDMVYAAMAETMLLTFEEKFVDYSQGDSVNPDKLEEIADLAVQHGFEVWVPETPIN
jgi:fatty aldehyde-generating acyl-ACP reductase